MRFAKLPELGSSNFTSPFRVGAGDAKIHVWLSLPPPGRAQFAAAEMNSILEVHTSEFHLTLQQVRECDEWVEA